MSSSLNFIFIVGSSKSIDRFSSKILTWSFLEVLSVQWQINSKGHQMTFFQICLTLYLSWGPYIEKPTGQLKKRVLNTHLLSCTKLLWISQIISMRIVMTKTRVPKLARRRVLKLFYYKLFQKIKKGIISINFNFTCLIYAFHMWTWKSIPKNFLWSTYLHRIIVLPTKREFLKLQSIK